MTSSAPSKTSRRPAAGEVGFDAWHALIVVNARLMNELDQELREEHDFTLGDFDVLVQLANAPGQRLRMCDLAEAVLLSPSGLSRRVDRLERVGLVTRERGEADGRNVEAGLTTAGKRLFRRLRETHRAGIEQRFIDRFSPQELATLSRLLGRLT
jgi:DNA-binding MarR family transcriptional regulator